MEKEKTPLATKIAYTTLVAIYVFLVATCIAALRIAWLESGLMALFALGLAMISMFPFMMISVRNTFLAIKEIWQGTYMERFINKRQQH